MSKRTHFTTITPLPAGITRETVLAFLHSHTDMIDLNPLVIDRHPIKPPPEASPEEFTCQWYSVSDRISYLPGIKGKLSFNACFHDLPDGLQTHIYAPMGLNMKGRWTLGGTLPGEPKQATEIGLGVPKHGLWLREDVDMKCNVMMTGFVKGTTKKTHSTLVERLIERSHLREAEGYNNALKEQLDLRSQYPPDYDNGGGRGMFSPVVYPPDGKPPLQHTPSVSDSVSLRSNGGSAGGRGSIGDPHRASFPSPPQPYPGFQLGSQGYDPHLQPAPLRTSPPYPQQGMMGSPGMHQEGFRVEAPGLESRTPVEMDSGEGGARWR